MHHFVGRPRHEAAVDYWDSVYLRDPLVLTRSRDTGLCGIGRGAPRHVVEFNADGIAFALLAKIIIALHHPVHDAGTKGAASHSSGIYYRNDLEKKIVKSYFAYLESKKKYDEPIVTEVEPFNKFWLAEDYHQNYYEIPENHRNPYVVRVTKPKVEKFLKKYPDLVKAEYRSEK